VGARAGVCPMGFSPEAVAAMESHSWPGNVRELENRVRRAAIMAEGKLISAEDLGFAPTQLPACDFPSLREVRNRAELEALQRALAVAGGNVSKAAELLGVTRPTLYALINRLNLRPSDN
jgi:two-component system, NtrC family, response regulator